LVSVAVGVVDGSRDVHAGASAIGNVDQAGVMFAKDFYSTG
jgi:hypothetical protein